MTFLTWRRALGVAAVLLGAATCVGAVLLNAPPPLTTTRTPAAPLTIRPDAPSPSDPASNKAPSAAASR
ncbi:hypothetical protein [Kitasatospora kifunensis]|uniref:Uncharacterized protein n=1 Tax=Kitasatospora kifunensis TaxID=58351 RepID=A0A7W7VXB1_KITKI|nr:hypothetical protein [Kitasatospora kifunensis]MBB4926412.1 hypothetical protein [Kitasatospora kifunensis]